MSLSGALTALGNMTVVGVTTSYAYTENPIVPPEGELPALIINLFDTFNEGFRVQDIGETTGRATIWVEHLLLSSGYGVVNPKDAMSDVVTLIDAYLTDLKGDFKMADNLYEPTIIANILPGGFEYSGQMYWGVRFQHKWVLVI